MYPKSGIKSLLQLSQRTSKNRWSGGIMDLTNRSAPRKAIKAHLASRVHIINKLVHKRLPATRQQHRRFNGTRKCPTWSSITKDRDYMNRCGSPTRQEWREKFCLSMNKFHREHVFAPEFQFLREMAMDQWLVTSEGDTLVKPSLFPVTISSTALQQNAIVWRQVFNWRFSNGLSTVQGQRYANLWECNDGCKDEWTGQQWQRRFINCIRAHWFTLWN